MGRLPPVPRKFFNPNGPGGPLTLPSVPLHGQRHDQYLFRRRHRVGGAADPRRHRRSIDEADDLTLTAMAARHLGHWEIIDYASDTKPDVPSGTARELAETLAQVREPARGSG